MMSQTLAPPAALTPSFVDLKAWAASAPLRPSETWRVGREALPLDDAAVAIEALRLGAGSGHLVPGQPADEFLHILSGELTLAAGGVTLDLGPGESAVIPAGLAFDWRCAGEVRLVAMRCLGAPTGLGLRRMDPALPLAPSGPPLAELLLTPTPSCRNLTQFTSADGAFVCGVWDSTPYTRTAMAYGHHELMHLLAGEVTFQDEQGVTATFKAGDLFVVLKGARCSWDSPTDVTKVFAIHRPG